MAGRDESTWVPASSLLFTRPVEGRRSVGLVGVATYQTSLSPRSSQSTPDAIRRALGRFSTWSIRDDVDLASRVAVVDAGDVDDPDGDGALERLRAMLAGLENSDVVVILGGDNAATWLGCRAIGDLSSVGLVTLDAHLDCREGRSNGSPVRQLLNEGLDGRALVQVGLADFSNSATHAAFARAAGATVIARDAFYDSSPEDLARRALDVAGAKGRRVYLDVDVDVADQSSAPACPAAAPGGLSADEIRRFVRTALADPRVVAVDVTEIDPARDSADERTVRLAALLVLECLAGVARR